MKNLDNKVPVASVFAETMHIFAEIMHIFAETMHVFAEIMHIFAETMHFVLTIMFKFYFHNIKLWVNLTPIPERRRRLCRI